MSIDDPLTAIAVFFLAVLMVIVATYLLFIAGSVALCRLLQKKKSYYYQPAHSISVSSMAFRMKRNGAGLAPIRILATMVLVMLSPTSCLYFGGEDAVRGVWPLRHYGEIASGPPMDCSEETLAELFVRWRTTRRAGARSGLSPIRRWMPAAASTAGRWTSTASRGCAGLGGFRVGGRGL